MKDKDLLNAGGMPFMATSLFAAGMGPVLESTDSDLMYCGKNQDIEYTTEKVDGKWVNVPYSYDEDDDWSLPEEDRFLHSFVLNESFMLPDPAQVDEATQEYTYNSAATDAIKTMLEQGRAVQIGFCADTSKPNQEEADGKYISKNWAHYTYDEQETINHAVTIVGWDDNYPATNFVEGHEPKDDGAWLVKNSWGSEEQNFPNKGPGWGLLQKPDQPYNPVGREDPDRNVHTGYFWLSYYDKTLSSPEALEFKENNVDSSLDDSFIIDQYDFMPTNDVEGASVPSEMKMANVFKAESNELLTQVSCQTTYPGTTVTNEIYLLSDGFTSPADGLLVEEAVTTSGPYDYGGFHKVELAQPVQIQKGQSYAIVQTQRIDGEEYGVNFPSAMGKVFSEAIGDEVYVEGVINPKESYIYADQKWSDMAEQSTRDAILGEQSVFMSIDNFPIKGYCTKVSDTDLRLTILGESIFEPTEGYNTNHFRARFKGHTESGAEAKEVTWSLSPDCEGIFQLEQDPEDPYKVSVTATGFGSGYLCATSPGIGTTAFPLTVRKLMIGGTMIADDVFTYNGKAKTPKLYVEDENGNLIPSNQYTTKYKNNVKCGRGRALVYIDPNNPKYEGDDEVGFTIKPAKVTLKSVTPGKKKLTVTIKNHNLQKKSGAKYYQVKYRIKGKKWQTKKVKVSSGSKIVLKKLKKGKKYQVKVRAYVPSKQFDLYGSFSKTKTSKKIKGLKSKQTYWVRIRAYNIAADVKQVSEWKSKKVKVK